MVPFLKIFLINISFCFFTLTTINSQGQSKTVDSSRKDTLSGPDESLDDNNVSQVDTNSFFYYFKYKVSADGQYSSGNVNRLLTVYRGTFDYHKYKFGISFNPNYSYGLQNGNLAEDDWLMNLSSYLAPKELVHALVFGQIERSHLRGIFLRWQAGIGPSFHLLNTKQHKLNVNNVVLFEKTEFYGTVGFNTVRNSIRLKGKHNFFKNHIVISHETFLQPSILDFNNYRVRTLISIELPFNDYVGFRLALQDSFDSIVRVGRERNDLQITFGLTFGNN